MRELFPRKILNKLIKIGLWKPLVSTMGEETALLSFLLRN